MPAAKPEDPKYKSPDFPLVDPEESAAKKKDPPPYSMPRSEPPPPEIEDKDQGSRVDDVRVND